MLSYLIVDDESLVRKGVIAKLAPLSDTLCCAGEAENGKEAMTLLAQNQPDILITDMNMPVMDGSDFLRAVMVHYPDMQIIIISGYRDFEYATQAIKARAVAYLLKPFSAQDIQKAVGEAISAIKNGSGKRSALADSGEEIEHTRYLADVKTLQNMLLYPEGQMPEIYSAQLRTVSRNHNYTLLSVYSSTLLEEARIKRFLVEGGFGDLGMYLLYPNSRHLVSLVLFTPASSVTTSNPICHQVASSFKNALVDGGSLDVLIGISGLHDELTDLHTAFSQSVTAMNHHSPKGDNWVYFYEKTSRANPISWAKEDKFLFCIEAGMVDDVTALIKQLFAQLDSERGYSWADIKNYCFHLSERALTMATSYFENWTSRNMGASSQIAWDSFFSLEKLERFYTDMFTNMAVALQDKSAYSSADTVGKMKLYVQHNFKKNITVELLADFFYMSRSYCSHLFKAQTGQNFVDYLNEVRLTRAKELLRETNEKMYQVAKQVGYDNVKYFFRVFKNKTGVTPEQYRAGNKDGKGE